MGCCTGDREKLPEVNAQQKWEYINLDDFKSKSCWTPIAYGYLYFMLFISISVYALDTFTAINLLAFDKWASQVQPAIPLSISRWIFAGCIILSFVLLFYRWLRAIRVMRQSGVASSYLDPLAVRIQSARMGSNGRGWKRFLVFAELTKSKKGADYVALFAHYTFEAWLRIIFAEGPRQVVNALTLYAVLNANLIPEGAHAATGGNSPLGQFFVNVGILAQSNKEQAIVLSSMLWTLVLWVFSMLSLISAVILYLIFLWHHIPSQDGGLSGYCRRKINKRLERIVKAKVDKALAQENAIRVRQAAKEGLDFKRQPTLPDLGAAGNDSLPPLSRQTTMTTLPEYSSRPQTQRESSDSLDEQQPTLPSFDTGRRPSPPARADTQASATSWNSYSSRAPLMNEASDMGYAPLPLSRAQTSSSIESDWTSQPPPPGRSMTGMSQSTQRSMSSATGSRPGPGSSGRNTPGSYQMEPLSADSQGRRTPFDQNNPRFPPVRSQSAQGAPFPPRRQLSSDDSQGRRTPATTTNPYFPPILESTRRGSPAPTHRSQTPNGASSLRSYTPIAPPPNDRSVTPGRSMTPSGQPTLPRLQTSSTVNNGGYIAFTPGANSSNPNALDPQHGVNRSFSRPMVMPQASDYYGRPVPESSHSQYPPRNGSAAPVHRRGDVTDNILDSY